jgi:hypothetical protein
MSTGKPRIAKDYDKLSEDIINQIKLEYPFGFEDNLISYKNAQGTKVSALPFEAAEVYYLVRMTKSEAQQIIEDDDDYDDDGNLRDGFADDVDGSDSEEEEDKSYEKDKPQDNDDED